jgi:DNA polymerase III epsilon subunit family exonuclease
MIPILSQSATLISIDCETTGLDYKNEKIIEIAAVRFNDDGILDTYQTLVNPEIPIKHSSFKIHGISDDDVANAPTIAEVLPTFLAFMGDTPYVAHNALFDYSFINQATKEYLSQRFTNPRIDSLELYRSVFPEEPSHGLAALLARFGIPQETKHRALEDAEGLARAFPRLNQLYQQKYAWQLNQLGMMDYWIERYLRLQKTIQILQSEMSDIKDIFKLYFQQGGRTVEASTGERMVYGYRRSYSYDEQRIWDLLFEAGLTHKAFKLNPRAFERLMDRGNLDPDLKALLAETRTTMQETKTITFVKPSPPVADEPSSNGKAPAEAVDAESLAEVDTEDVPAV